MIDRADELRATSDLWPEISKYLDGFMFPDGVLEAKFRKGEAEHGRDWLDMTRSDLEHAIEEELMDMIIYRAMVCARWPDEPGAPAFLTNRDPGDEGPEYVVAPV